MQLSSFTFLLCWGILLCLYHGLRGRGGVPLLLFASLLFYGAFHHLYLILMLLAVSVVTWYAAVVLEKRDDSSRRRLFWGGVAINVAGWACFHLPFLNGTFAALIHRPAAGATLPVLLVTVGVSYYILQAIAYLADVYLELIPAEQSWTHLALSLCFFPKLLQGPIERGGDILPQLHAGYRFSPENLISGAQLFLYGMFKKLVVADRLAAFVDPVYGDVHAHGGLPLLLATYAFSLQLYFDFSGYTDMARGTALTFNVSLRKNFDSPYLASSLAEFWRRWHISFSSWILDYLFRPLQMALRDRRETGTALALLITFALSGFWHGASWNFLVWGLIHGTGLSFLAVVGSSSRRKPGKKAAADPWGFLRKLGGVLATYHVVCFAWIFFRAATIGDAWFVATHLFGNVDNFRSFALMNGMPALFVMTLTLASLLGVRLAVALGWDRMLLRNCFLRWSWYYSVIAMVVFFAASGNKAFIYTRF